MAYRNKKKYLLQYQADITIIPECERLGSNNSKRIWFGKNRNKGLGIFSHSEYRLMVQEDFNQNIEYIVPLQVRGRDDFNLLAVWARNDKKNVQNRYIGQVWAAVNYYKELLTEPTIIIGDFNWNRCFDQTPSFPLSGNFNDVISFLKKMNMTSAYHEFMLEDYGQETHPTLFLHHKEDKPFHVDYCFVSKDFEIKNVEVGTYTEWIRESDHVPLTVTLTVK